MASPIKIIQNQPGSLILEISLDSVWIDSSRLIHTIPALLPYQKPGYPVLPFLNEVLIGVPVNSSVQLFQGTIQVISEVAPTTSTQEQAKGIAEVLSYNPWEGDLFPVDIVTLSPASAIKEHVSSVLEVFPVQIVDSNLQWSKNNTIYISWQPADRSFQPKLLSRSRLTKIGVRQHPNRSARTATIPAYQFSENIAKISLDSTGWYAITKSELADSGLAINGVDPRTFRLWNQDKEILLFVEGEMDGYFNTGDRILFYGEKNPAPDGAPYKNNFYTAENIYWLTWGGNNGARYILESAYPDLPTEQVFRPSTFRYTERIERDEYFARLGYVNTHEQWDAFDHFFMEPPINAGTSVDFELDLAYPSQSTVSRIDVRLAIQGITTGFHYIQVLINDKEPFGITWTGQTAEIITSLDNQAPLYNGSNKLTIINLEESDENNRYDQVYLNWVDITYDRLYKAKGDKIIFTRDSNLELITQYEIEGFTVPEIFIFKENVSRLSDFIVVYDTQDQTYTAILQDFAGSEFPVYHAFTAEKLKKVNSIQPSEPIEPILDNIYTSYIAISPDSFRTTLKPLIEDHYSGVIIDIDDIYRQFSGGVVSPYAVKDFLREVYLSGSGPLENVLIAMQGRWFGWSGGTGTTKNYIPSMKIQTYKFGAVSSDFWYACVDGDDLIPEFSIGRFPARDKNELNIIVTKTLNYINLSDQSWHNTTLLIGGYEIAFKDQSETLINRIVKEALFPKRIYIDQYSEGGSFFGNTETLLQYMNEGLTYINFFGHGGGAVWGDRSLFMLGDLDYLENGVKTPFITSMTCFTGDVTNPNSLGRQMVSLESGGAVAWFGSAGVGWIINDYLLLLPIHELIFSNREMTIGEIINQAKVHYLSTNLTFPTIAKSQVSQFNLTGDPALRIRLPQTTEITVDPEEINPGETLTVSFPYPTLDSLEIRLFNTKNKTVQQYRDYGNSAPFNIEFPVSDTIQSGNYSLIALYKYQDNFFHGGDTIGISGFNARIINTDPIAPTRDDSIYVIAEVTNYSGLDSVQLWMKRLDQRVDENNNFISEWIHNFVSDMSETENGYRSDQPIPPTSLIYDWMLYCRIEDQAGKSYNGPVYTLNIRDFPDFAPMSLNFSVEDSINLIAVIKNYSPGAGEAIVEFQRKIEGNDWVNLGVDRIQFEGIYEQIAKISGIFPRGVNTYRVITNAVDVNTNFDNDTLITNLETTAFWITDTAAAGIQGLDVLPQAGTGIIQIRSLDEIETATQPDFKFLIPDTIRQGIEIITTEDSRYSVQWQLSSGISNMTLYRYFEDFDTWLPWKVSLTDSVAHFDASGSGRFAFMESEDVQPPRLEATINGQRFLNNSYVNKTPVIYLTAQDENGLDHRVEFMDVWMNTNDSIDVVQVNGKANILGIQLNPILSESDTMLHVIVRDASGNLSDTLNLKFVVREQLDLIDYGNYPNPFKDQTRFAYELTETVDEFSLDLYTVDGRRIRRFTSASALTDQDPKIGAYHEIVWDGRSESGDFVANGVYFYRMVAKKGETVIERIGKVAKTR